MNKITTKEVTFDVSENTMIVMGSTETGEVKSIRPLEGDANNEKAMQEIAAALIGKDGITSVAFLPAYFIFKASATPHSWGKDSVPLPKAG
jgi:hypothetical protein